jgi:phospholipase/lecithinase/hemolysin
MRSIRALVFASLLLLFPCQAALAGLRGAIGVLGDSYSDEYQFYPPDRSTARNWVEILAATRGLDFGRFSEVSRGEPRNQGFAFNWARSDATTDDLIATGQHTGLAAQVAGGEVGLAVIYIGGNDFIHALQSPDPIASLERVRPRALANHRVAVETILGAHGDVKVVLVTLSDLPNLPEFAGPIRSGRLRRGVIEAYAAAIAEFNAQIRSIAAGDPRVAVLDLDLATRFTNIFGTGVLKVDGLRVDRERPDNRPEHFFLAVSRHPGTIVQGLLAKLLVETINARFDAGLSPLTEREITGLARSLATLAGVSPGEPGEHPIPDANLAGRTSP